MAEPAPPRTPPPRREPQVARAGHRLLEALCRLAPDRLRGELTGLVHRLDRFAEGPERATPDSVWWAARLLRETLLRAPDARAHLPVLHALADHVARPGPGEFGSWFWIRLRLPEPDRLDLLRRLWQAAAGAEAAALIGPSARRRVETLSRAAADVT
ncbi:hypothetical protein ACWGIU_33165 [Streptomyces sp. NPDC054840]